MKKKLNVATKAVILAVLALVVGLVIALLVDGAFAGEKEQLQAQLVALVQEERAMNAEFQLYQAKLQDIQQRFPAVKKEQADLQAQLTQLKAIEEREKAAKSPEAPKKPEVKK